MGNSLLIESERRSEHEGRGESFRKSEWTYGRFSRRIPLPEEVDPDQVKASFQNGVLEISIPHTSSETARETPIEAVGATSGPSGRRGS